jgi:DNA-binding SARP family transcriptional activator
MTERVAISALGSLQVIADGQRISLGGRQQRILLGVLVAYHPESASTGLLEEAIWQGEPPPKSVVALQSYVSRLRRILAPAAEIRSGSQGYRLVLGSATIDATEFVRVLAEAKSAAAARRFAQVIALLTPALGWWRSAVPLEPWQEESWAQSYSSQLRRGRLAAVELLAEAHLFLGHPGPAIALLEPLVSEYPYAESTVQLLMIAFYRAGRQADALNVFLALRSRLAEDLGVDPSQPAQGTYAAVLRQSPELDWEPPAPAIAPLLPVARNRLLFGRSELIHQIQSTLADVGLLTLYGLPGSGKTAVAAEIAHQHEGLVCWVPAEDAASAVTALSELAERLGVPLGLGESDLLAAVWETLPTDKPWLMVYDNAEDLESLRPFLPTRVDGQVLVTSQNSAWSKLGPARRMEPLSDEASAQFILRRSGRDHEDPSGLIQAIGGLPLALEQACSYIDETGMSLAQYLGIFRRREHELLGRGAPVEHPNPVSTTWGLAFASIRAESALAARILEAAAFLSAENVPFGVLAPVLGYADELTTADAFATLRRYSIVERRESSLRVHRLVQDLVRSWLSPEERTRVAALLARRLRNLFPTGVARPEVWPQWETLAPQVLALLRACASCPAVPASVLELVLPCYRYLRTRGSFDAALVVLDTALELVDPDDHIRRGEFSAVRGDLLDSTGQLTEAQRALQAALSEFDRSEIPAPPIVLARTWVLLAHVMHCADASTEAGELYRRALPVLKAAGETEETAAALLGLGYALWGQRSYADAEAVFREARALVEQAGWTGEPLHAEAVSGLGMMLHEQGRCEQARDLQLLALAELRRIHGTNAHDSIAYTLDKLGYAEGLLGNHQDSLEHHRAAAEILESLFGPSDPRLGMIVSNAGNAYAALGQHDAALASQQTAYAIVVERRGPGHRDSELIAARIQALLQPAATAH